MSNAPRVVLRSNRSTAEQVRDARARAWTYIFQCWQAKKGAPRDLAGTSTKECTRPDQKGKDSADIHGNGL
jgi:hypothetical protein